MAARFKKGDLAVTREAITAPGSLLVIPTGVTVTIKDVVKRGGWRYQVRHKDLLLWAAECELSLPLEAMFQ